MSQKLRLMSGDLAREIEPGYGSAQLTLRQNYFKAGNRPLAIGGALLVITALIVQLTPPVIRSSNVFNGLVSAALALYVLVGFLYLRNSFRITFPIFVLGLIQVWIASTVFLGPQIFALEMKLGRNIWWPAFIMMPYLAAFILVAIDVRWRDRLLNFILGVCVFTAIIGILQFIKFPGMFQFSNMYVDLVDLEPLGLAKRSHGLSTHPFHLSAQCILGIGVVASNLLFRKLRTADVVYYAILSAGLIVAQARTFYLVWLVLTIFTLIMVFRRSKPQGMAIVALMGVMITAIVIAFPDQLSYGLSNKNTISEGRMAQWMRADELFDQYPLTGIGPKETVFGSGKDFSGGGRFYSLYTESGYRMSKVSGGVIELGLMILLVISSFYLTVRVAWDQSVSEMRRRAAFTGFYYIVAMGVGLYITNIVENELMTYYGMVLMALIAPQMNEVYSKYRNRSARVLRRVSSGLPQAERLGA